MEGEFPFLPDVNFSKLKFFITGWISFWPVYLALMIFENLVKEIIDWVITKLKSVFVSVTGLAFRSLS